MSPREYPLAQAFTLELFRGRAVQVDGEYKPGMVSRHRAVPAATAKSG